MPATTESAVLRPMRPADVPAAQELSALTFAEVDRRLARPGDVVHGGRTPERAAAWIARTEHLLGTDPGGCWVAEVDGRMLGLATSAVRDKTWILATYVVHPDAQGQGLGRPLLDAALHHGRACLRGMLASSRDPRAVRRYFGAGFGFHPALLATGAVDRNAIPVVTKVREGTPSDFDLMDSIDRRVRDAAHGPDHEVLFRTNRLVVSDTSTGSGYAYQGSDGRIDLLAATHRRTAARLLWECLAATDGETLLGRLTGANQWAIEIALQARLELSPGGFLALRGMDPPAPYLYHGSML